MILFRSVLRIYAIGDSDKPRERGGEREREREKGRKKKSEDKVAASERYVLYFASVRAERRGDVSERETYNFISSSNNARPAYLL